MNDQTTPNKQEEVARLINRLTDRILPDTSAQSDNPSPYVRYGVTFFGALTWALFWLWLVASKQPTADGAPIFSEFGLGPIVLYLATVLAVMFSALIGASVRRGTPLNFYIWGLTVPVLVLNILKFANFAFK